MNRGRHFLLFLALLAGPVNATRVEGQTPVRVAYVQVGPTATAEDSAALSWLAMSGRFIPVVLRPEDSLPLWISTALLWCHLPDSTAYHSAIGTSGFLERLRGAIRGGGRVLFTDYAALLPSDLGFETERPAVRYDTLRDDWLFDKKGFQSFRGHPLFAGLFGGEFVWDGMVDRVLPFVGYFGGRFPARGRVVGVEKSYVFLHQDRRLIIEHSLGRSKLISVGGEIYFAWPNTLRRNLEKFIQNALLYLSGSNLDGPVTYWEHAANTPRQFVVRSASLRTRQGRAFDAVPTSGLALVREKGGKDFFDLAGRRALVMGKESGGIDELWVHPFRVLRDYEAGVLSGDSVLWLNRQPVSIVVRPESFTRTYRIPQGELKEVLVASHARAGAILRYETAVPVRLVIRFRSDLRWMWPYDANSLGDLHFAYDDGLHALHVRDSSGTFACLMGADREPASHLEGQFATVSWRGGHFAGSPTEENQVFHAALFDLTRTPVTRLNVALVGTNDGTRAATADYRVLLSDPAAVAKEAAEHYRTLLENRVEIDSPDREFNRLYRWNLVGVDRFVARTPGVGEGLLAGFATTASGWDGAQRVSGRPGYAWYFGRDAVWSGFAFDAAGDHSTVRRQLEFFQRYQDLSGKIFHELSTSGVIHFDAADATPLYIILAAHYVRASGDLLFLKQSWPCLRKAISFLYSTDTDGDGLIENTNQGHGWIEGGKLFGAHTTFYLACLWARALDDAAYMAGLLGRRAETARYGRDGKKVREILNSDFWNGKDRFFYYGKWKDGSYNPEPTVLPAVGMYFGLLDDEKARPCLLAYAGNGFTTEWGVRILSAESPIFNPRGYHQGSVWPLFSGWAALAEYTYGRSAQAFSHLYSTLHIKDSWALGFVEEVMHGLLYQPSGVCPHQCWSETAALHPAIEGMVGWKPDAPARSATVAPRFPLDWDSVAVRNLRSGTSSVSLEMTRTGRSTTFKFLLQKGAPCTIRLAPEIAQGMHLEGVSVEGRPVEFDAATDRGLLRSPVTFLLTKSTTIVLRHRGGVGLVPLITHPLPGDSAWGVRPIDMELKGDQVILTAEGKPGTTATIPLAVFDRPVPRLKGVRPGETPGVVNVEVPFDQGVQRYVRQTAVVDLK